MYNVILIDDEKWSIESILHLIKWEDYGYRVVKTFTNPELAYDYFTKVPPDLIFIDIKMPSISGIDLVKKYRSEYNTKIYFVALSGFDDFKFAQSALQLEFYDYRLKPIDKNELINLLENLSYELENKYMLRDSKILNKLSDSSFKEILTNSNFKCKKKYWQAFTILSKNLIKSEEFNLLFNNSDLFILNINYHKKIILYNYDNVNDKKDFIDYLSSLCALQKFKIGCSLELEHPQELISLINQSEYAVYDYYLNHYKTCQIVYYKNKSMEPIISFIENATSLIASKEFLKVIKIIDNIPMFIKNNKLNMKNVLYLYNSFLNILNLRTDYEFHYEYLDCSQFTDRYLSINDMCDFIKKSITKISNTKIKEDVSFKTLNTNFKELLEYINSHFTEQLNLTDLSEEYYFSFTYCCHLFKKYTGYTFSEYINIKRLEKAHEMLSQKNLTITYISNYVGYNDQYYFSKRFKKHYGYSPSEVAKK